MRIDRLELIRCGPFTEQTLDLSGGEYGVHLVMGPNEAGKSSALRALRDALFGFDTRTTDNFKHANSELRVGLSLRRKNGEQVSFERRKGTAKTLRQPGTEQPLNDQLLETWLSGVDRKLFSNMFGLTYDALVAGGRELAELQGNLGESLFAAAGGVSRLRSVTTQFAKEAEELFKSSGSRPRLNVLLREHNELRKASERVASKDYAERLQRRDERRQQLLQIEEQQRASRVELSRLERLKNALPLLAQRRECLAELAEFADTVELRAEFEGEMRRAKQTVDRGDLQQRQDDAEWERLQTQIAAIAPPSWSPELIQELTSLSDQLGGYRKAQQDLPALRAKHAQLRAGCEEQLQRLRPDLSWDRVAEVRLPLLQENSLRRLQEEGQQFEGLAERMQEDLDKLQTQLRDDQQLLAQLAAPADESAVRQLVGELHALAVVESQLVGTTKSLATERTQLAKRLTKLGRWPGKLEELSDLGIPAAATIQQEQRRRDKAERELDELAGELRRAEEELRQNALKLAELKSSSGQLPTLADLQAARNQRNQLWIELVVNMRREPLQPATLRELTAPYEAAVLQADQIADQLRLEQQRIVEFERLSSLSASLEGQVAERREKLAQRQQRWQEQEEAWLAIWSALQITGGTPAEMQEWRSELEQLQTAEQAWRLRQAEQVESAAEVQAGRERLSQVLSQVGLDELAENESLKSGLQRAEDWVVRQHRLAEQRSSLERTSARLQQQQGELQRRQQEQQQRLNAWRTNWTQALLPLGLPTDTTPRQVDEYLREAERLQVKVQEAAALAVRIQAIELDGAKFEELVKRLAGELKMPPDPQVELTARRVSDELRRSERERDQRDDFQTQLKKLEKQREKRRSELEGARVSLRSLLEEARVDGVDDWELAWGRSQAKRQCQQKREAIDKALYEMSLGQSIGELEEEARAIHHGELTQRLEQERLRFEQLDAQRQPLHEEVGQLNSELQRMSEGTAAIASSVQLQAKLGSIEQAATEYARARLATVILRRAVEEFSRRHQGPMLQRASEYFARLTVEAFARMDVDYSDEGQPFLVGIRSGGGAVGVAGMSEGTADQMFLALRLAYLADWLDRKEPLPVVFDDVLIKFDDRRAAATLGVLADFSSRTQVIVFTHHEHLLEIAREQMPADRLFTYRLGGGSDAG
ncbi:MAG: AAA family ATPase [Planctomycetota bacterium]